ncbi:MAG: hypothetical protein LEGION0398_MBIBDBAK_01262 [Legionellaceae bacterium]
MGILRLFKQSNILESNIVQTAASAGEALVSGIAFIIPALIILHIWSDFNYFETVLIAMIGGILGVLFTVPLRRILLKDKNLTFPEGTAIGNVLKASTENAASIKYLLQGGFIGSFIALTQTGFKAIAESIAIWLNLNGLVIGFELGFSPALIAAGYIIGIQVGISILFGIIIGWWIGIPYLSFHDQNMTLDAATQGITIWKDHIRYIGVGTMIVGGLWTLINLIKPIIEGIHSSFASLQNMRVGGMQAIPRTERDIPINYMFWSILILIIPLALFFWFYASPLGLSLGHSLTISLTIAGTLFAIFAGFIFASICGYFTGLVGSTNNPLSALTLGALMLSSTLILIIIGSHYQFHLPVSHAMKAASFALIISAVVACAAAITNDTIQDLKAGEMVGATPWKQQVMLIVGVVVAALIIPLVLKLLFNAYGISGVFPRPGMDPSQMLSAPQASAMAVVVQGVFISHLPWSMLSIGALIAIICLIIDKYLKTYGYSFPVLGVGLGIYIPLETTSALIMGSFSAYFIKKALEKLYDSHHPENTLYREQRHQRGLILACGIVAGATLMGVLLAIPFVIFESTDVLRLLPIRFNAIATILGILSTTFILAWFYKTVCRNK